MKRIRSILVATIFAVATSEAAAQPASPEGSKAIAKAHATGSWVIQGTAAGLHDGQYVRAQRCGNGALPHAIVEAKPDGGVGTDEVTYSLLKEGDGWRLDIVRLDATGHKQDASGLTATVKTACLL